MVQLPSPQSEHNQQMPDAIPKLETDYNGLTKNLKEANELLLNSNNKQSTQFPIKMYSQQRTPPTQAILIIILLKIIQDKPSAVV